LLADQEAAASDPLAAAQLQPADLLAQLRAQLGGGGQQQHEREEEEHQHEQRQEREQHSVAGGGFEIPAPLWEELADDFCAEANQLYRAAVAQQWQQQQLDSGEQQEQRRAYEQRVAKVVDAYAAICLFERGADAFDGQSNYSDSFLKLF
jgi:hypothetical protein